MKKRSPLSVVFIGSLSVVLFLSALLWLFGIYVHLRKIEIVLLLLLVFLVCFTVFYVVFRSFIFYRINVLYRSIRTGKLKGEAPFKMSMSKDLIGEASTEASNTVALREEEMSVLLAQDAFRREFIGNLSHELKTPIFSIQGYIETLLDGGLEDEKINRKFLERSAQVVERMNILLSDLDVLSKLEMQSTQIEMRPFDIRKSAMETMDNLEILASQKKIQLRFSKNVDKELFVVGDKHKIEQVFTNLINNSIAYGNEGGLTEIRFFEMDNIVSVEVSDNGPGIDKVHLPRLFERFYRVEKSRNRNEGGTGLGLAIVKHIMEAHKQTISVRSTVNKGSTFTFSLEKYKGSTNPIISSRGLVIKS